MASDMVVALKEASANGTTLFALNQHAATDQRHCVTMAAGQLHDVGATTPTSQLKVPQARQTFAVLGMQPRGQWGFNHGVNEHRVAVGVTEWTSRLQGGCAALNGTDLVRLALERSHSAHHAVEILTDLLERFGPPMPSRGDFIFLIADANEAFALEVAGRFWALLECGHSRVVTDAGMIRQDWRRLSPGLACYVIEQGWAQDDGSKIDFMRCLGTTTDQAKNAQKRWGRASLALAQQQGAIDAHFLRRMLGEHASANRDLLPGGKETDLACTMTIELHAGDLPIVSWIAFGPPSVALYFPIAFAGEIPVGFGDSASAATSIEDRIHHLVKLAHGTEKERGKLTQALERLQAKFDLDGDDFLLKAHDFASHGKAYLVGQIATEMMHNHVELFDREYRRQFGVEDRLRPSVDQAEEVLFFA